jgi:DNA-directed RNA polymerase specialized sigma24 family protein
MAKEGPATLDDLLKQAKTTNRLLAAQLKAQMSQMDVIRLLSDLGLTAREIGEILGTSAATVAVTQQRLRNKKRKTQE